MRSTKIIKRKEHDKEQNVLDELPNRSGDDALFLALMLARSSFVGDFAPLQLSLQTPKGAPPELLPNPAIISQGDAIGFFPIYRVSLDLLLMANQLI